MGFFYLLFPYLTHKIKYMKILWTNVEDEIIKTNYSTKTIEEICQLIPNRTYGAIKLRKGKLKLFKRLPSATYNEIFFSIPNLINCQLAGFISADGCINFNNNKPRLMIHISQKDLKYLQSICKTINYNGTIYLETKHNTIKNYRNLLMPARKSISDTCSISIWNCKQYLVELENNFSITPRKTLTLQPPKLDDLDLALSFISGNIDGDGSIVLYDRPDGHLRARLNISLLGTYDFLSWVKRWIDKILPVYQRSQVRLERLGSKIYNYVVSGAEAYIFSKMILSLDILRMDRKWDKAREYIQIFESQQLSQDMEIKLRKLLNKDIISFVTSRGGNFPDNFLKLII